VTPFFAAFVAAASFSPVAGGGDGPGSPPEGFAFVVDDDGGYFVTDGDLYVVTEA
jgi:hypothetical protein